MRASSSFVLFAAFTALLVVGSAESAVGGGFKVPIGLQRDSLRDDFAKDVPGTLDKEKADGIKEVELAGTYKLEPEKFKEMLHARGLKPISGHFPYERFRDDIAGVVRD